MRREIKTLERLGHPPDKMGVIVLSLHAGQIFESGLEAPLVHFG